MLVSDYIKKDQTVYLDGQDKPEKMTVRESKHTPVYGFIRIGKETRHVARIEPSFSCSTWREVWR